jgi:hypothetical protein
MAKYRSYGTRVSRGDHTAGELGTVCAGLPRQDNCNV